MTRTVDVLSIERVVEEGERFLRVHCDEVDSITPSHYSPPGDDCPPLPGDVAVVDDAGEQVFGFIDPANAGVALGGEKRWVSRDAERAVVGVIYMRRDGTYEIGLNPQRHTAVAELVLEQLSLVQAELTALKTAIGTAAVAEAGASGLSGMNALNGALSAWPSYTPESVASEEVKIT